MLECIIVKNEVIKTWCSIPTTIFHFYLETLLINFNHVIFLAHQIVL